MAFLKALVALAAALQVCAAGKVPCYSGVKMLLPPPRNNNNSGLQQSLADSISSAIPGSFLHIVPYDSYNSNASIAVANGSALMRSEIRTYRKSCPTSPIVLLGYSEGGIVVMNGLCGNLAGQYQLHPRFAKNVVAAISYGEETFVSGQSYDQGTCTSGQGVNPRTNSTSCQIYASKIHSYCDAPDPLCCGGNNITAHYTYNTYDNVATQFVVQQYNAFRAAQQHP